MSAFDKHLAALAENVEFDSFANKTTKEKIEFCKEFLNKQEDVTIITNPIQATRFVDEFIAEREQIVIARADYLKEAKAYLEAKGMTVHTADRSFALDSKIIPIQARKYVDEEDILDEVAKKLKEAEIKEKLLYEVMMDLLNRGLIEFDSFLDAQAWKRAYMLKMYVAAKPEKKTAHGWGTGK